MACGLALKRPYDYDDYLIEGSEVKRARHTQAHCSPFRAQWGTIAASLPNSSVANAFLHRQGLELMSLQENDVDNSSSLAHVGSKLQLSPGQLDSYLRAEIRYLKRRHLIPRRVGPDDDGSSIHNEERPLKLFRTHITCDSSSSSKDSDRNYREAPSSPNNNSGSESEGEVNIQKTSQMKDLYEKPHFSLKQFSFIQVKMICERLLKQQEIRLRYEYETVLNQRLEEQHEQYVQFAREQLERQHQDNGAELSYLS
ncbi:unnamed protein product [Thelazia callipaeda]|uniref:Akirin n=1 Tax=Thelazia callipaeda TaxID=103827 RepID=A0A0N5CRM8_THECL|nr:unnamed protein product [Thelazia callipaeda]